MKYLYVLIILFGCMSLLIADDPDIFTREEFGLDYDSPLNLYEISMNPALFRTYFQEDFYFYSVSAGKQQNGFRRTFDPEDIEDDQLKITNFKILDDRNSLTTRVDYHQSTYRKIPRSLEKDHYQTYFALTDSTTGTVRYDGPDLAVMYTYSGTRWKIGTELNYGVERGLKDVFTECETISRNTELHGGAVYQSTNRNLVTGISAGYSNRQRTYEAVKKYQDAQVFTYIGYNVYRDEGSYVTARKNDFFQAYDLNLHFSKSHLFRNIDLLLNYTWAEFENRVEVGDICMPKPRGYLSGNEQTIFGALAGRPEKVPLAWQIYYELIVLHEWATPGSFDVIKLKNDATGSRIGIDLFCQPSAAIRYIPGFWYRQIDNDYIEYAVTANTDITFHKKRQGWKITNRVLVSLNQIAQMYIELYVSEIEPEYYWQVDNISIRGLEYGYDRLFTFGRLGATIFLELSDPSDFGAIYRSGINLMYWR